MVMQNIKCSVSAIVSDNKDWKKINGYPIVIDNAENLNRQNKRRIKFIQNKIYIDYWQGKRLVRDLDIAFLFKHAHLFILMAHEERSTQRIFL